MWKVLLAFVGHRAILLAVIFLVINSGLPSNRETPSSIPELRPLSSILGQFFSRVSEGPEFASLGQLMSVSPWQVVRYTTNPFLWLSRWISGLAGGASLIVLLVLSNIFFILFLWELVELLNRYISSDVAALSAFLAVLWPTSYEMSLGSALSLACYLSTLSFRAALDEKWWASGLAIGLLMLMDPAALTLMGVLVFLFWFLVRHLSLQDLLKRLGLLIVPFLAAVLWKTLQGVSVTQFVQPSALVSLFSGSQGLGWTFSSSFAGQSLVLVFYLAGAIGAAVTNSMMIHRIIPIGSLLVLMLSTPYGALASRSLLASPALQGIAGSSSVWVQRVVQFLLLVLGIYEVYAVFRAA